MRPLGLSPLSDTMHIPNSFLHRRLYLLWLLVVIASSPKSHALAPDDSTARPDSPPVEPLPQMYPHVHVVRLNSYRSIEDHEGKVRSLLTPLRPEGSLWVLVKRSNPATKHHLTDFVLIRALRGSGVVSALRDAVNTVRSVSPQIEHRRTLKGLRRSREDFEDDGASQAAPSSKSPRDRRQPESARPSRAGAERRTLGVAETRARSAPGLSPHGRRRSALAPDVVPEDDPAGAGEAWSLPRPWERASTSELPQKQAFGAGELWAKGIIGEGVRVAVFDTGIGESSQYFSNIVERTDWTEEGTKDDRVGHGTFVAGLIGGIHPKCPGIAPGAELLTFRVFAGAQVSYTSWFLDAFNYAIQVGVDILNLSIGGPDFADEPFTDKVNELTSAGIIVISAIGNDGPLWGSLNNPADMMEVIGVGGAEPDGSIAPFSSRGMTTHELGLPQVSYGRVKPDVVAYGRLLSGPSHHKGASCRRLSGTSVASPVVAGAVALMASAVPKSRRKAVVNPASVKRALLASSRQLSSSSMYEQGSGLLDIVGATSAMQQIDAEYVETLSRIALQGEHPPENVTILQTVKGPSAYLFPSYLDLTEAGCPLMWPHCKHALVPYGMPVTVNVTVLNPAGVAGSIEKTEWIPGVRGENLDVQVSLPRRFWPWAAGLGVHLSASRESLFLPGSKKNASGSEEARTREETAEGILRLTIVSPLEGMHSIVELPIRARVAPAPPREKRLLWDMFHSLKYPPGYVPRDSLEGPRDMLDWLGDHPHTNFHSFYRRLLLEGYYVDVLEAPLSCLSPKAAEKYGALLLIDSEDFFGPEEIGALEDLVKERGLGVVVASEWYNNGVMRSVRFEDDNTRSWWLPVSAGGNVPSLNALLEPFGVGFGNIVASGLVHAKRSYFRFESGNTLVRFPKGGELLYADDLIVARQNDRRSFRQQSLLGSSGMKAPVLGVTRAGLGAVAAYGDSNCIDTAYKGDVCHELFVDLIKQVTKRVPAGGNIGKLLPESVVLTTDLADGELAATPDAKFVELLRPHSRTLGRTPQVAGGTLEFRRTGPICHERNLFMEYPNKLSSQGLENMSIVLPAVQYAEPIGSSRNYYSRFTGQFGWWRRLPGVKESNGGIGESDSSRLSSSLKWDARASGLSGAFLILVSLAMWATSSSGLPGKGSRKSTKHSNGTLGLYRPSHGDSQGSSSSSSSSFSAGSLKYLCR